MWYIIYFIIALLVFFVLPYFPWFKSCENDDYIDIVFVSIFWIITLPFFILLYILITLIKLNKKLHGD